MTRTHLLGAVSAAALACISTAAFATPANIVAGGASLPAADYQYEMTKYNAEDLATASDFGNSFATPAPYGTQGSGAGLAGVIYNNLQCIATNNCGKTTDAAPKFNPQTGAGGTNVVHMAGSDSPLSNDQFNIWNGTYTGTTSYTTNFGASSAGNLIQLPAMGVGISIVVQNANMASNGFVTLTDDQICGIFSGKLSNWNQVNSALTPGAITVNYRSDGSGTSAIFTQHLAAVCNATNSNFSISNLASVTTDAATGLSIGTTTFSKLFTGLTTPFATTPVGSSGSSGVFGSLGGQTSSIGYLSPDYTSITTVIPGNTLKVAAVQGVGETVGTTPTTINIVKGLASAGAGAAHAAPPAQSAANTVDAWVPLIPVVTAGYPIVGYTTFVFPQCYANANIAKGVSTFLKLHYKAPAYQAIQNTNGFVTVQGTAAAKYVPAILANVLANTNGWNYNINNSTACFGKGGR